MPRFSLEDINDWLQQVDKYADTAENIKQKAKWSNSFKKLTIL